MEREVYRDWERNAQPATLHSIVGQERVKQLAQGRPMMMKHPSSKLITYLPVPTVLMQLRRPVQGESPGQRGEWEGGGPCGPQWGAGWPQPQTERLVTLQSLCPEWNLHKKSYAIMTSCKDVKF